MRYRTRSHPNTFRILMLTSLLALSLASTTAASGGAQQQPPAPIGPYCITGTVFHDSNENGAWDGAPAEPPLAGFEVSIVLDRNANTELDVDDMPPLEIIQTNAAPYRSTELEAGTYFVAAEPHSADTSWVPTHPQDAVMLSLTGVGGDLCEEINFGFSRAPRAITNAEIRSFEAQIAGSTVTVRWETITEIDNLGFNIWRSSDPETNHERVNDYLIPSQVVGTGGASYEFVEDSVPAGTWYYKLETITSSGETDGWHGPIPINVSDATAATSTRTPADTAPATATPTPTATMTRTLTPTSTATAARTPTAAPTPTDAGTPETANSQLFLPLIARR